MPAKKIPLSELLAPRRPDSLGLYKDFFAGKVKPLPCKPSALIIIALEDFRSVRQSSNYGIEMMHWHKGLSNLYGPKCTVCLAGSVWLAE